MHEHFDVVVTDMRMPEMDGVQLLQEVKNRYPHIVRIVLSGYSDREMMLRSGRLAHRHLSKPADETTLKNAINRSCALKDLLSQEAIRKTVSHLNPLPGLPELYAKIIDALWSPNPSIRKIGQVIAQKPGLTAEVLHLVNSAIFAFPQRVSDTAQAVDLLGDRHAHQPELPGFDSRENRRKRQQHG